MKHKLNTDRMRDISNHDASCQKYLNTVIKYTLKNVFKYSV